MTCDCIAGIDASFEKQGNPTRIDPAISLSAGWVRACITTCIPFGAEKKRGQKPTRLIANYCPSCGVAYE